VGPDSDGPNDNGANPVGENISGEITYASWGSDPYQFDLNGPRILNSTLTNNTVGLYSSGGGIMPVINCSSIHDNAQYGIFAANGSLVEAINNWWGHANGPTDGGTEFGDRIAGRVDYDMTLGLQVQLAQSPPPIIFSTYPLLSDRNGDSGSIPKPYSLSR